MQTLESTETEDVTQLPGEMPIGRSGHPAAANLKSSAQLLDIFKSVNRLLAEPGDHQDIISAVVKEITLLSDGAIGHLYLRDQSEDQLLTSGIWHLDERLDTTAFQSLTENTALERAQCMSGNVWDADKPIWISDHEKELECQRARAANDAGLKSGFGVPVRSSGNILGVLEVFYKTPREQDHELMDCLDSIGVQLGGLLSEYRAQCLTARHTKIVDQVHEIIALADSDGCIFDCNSSFLTTLGLRKERVIGRQARDFLGPPPEQEAFRNKNMADLERDGSWRGELTFPVADGSLRTFDISVVKYEDSSMLAGGRIIVGRDITENLNARESLRLNSAALNATKSAVLIVEALSPHKIVFANPSFQKMLGYKSSELVGDCLASLSHVDDNQMHLRNMLESSERDQSYQTVVQTKRKDGSVFMRKIATSPINNATGQLTHIISFSEDVTEDQKRDELLQRQATVIETMADAVVVSEPRGVILDCNEAYAQLVGIDREAIIGTNAAQYTSESSIDSPQVILDAIKSRGEWTGEAILLPRDGSERVVETRLTAITDPETKNDVIVTVAHDVTEQRKMEDHLQFQAALVKNIKEAMLVQNRDGIVIDCNDAACELYGYAREELIGMGSRHLAHPDFDVDAVFENAVPILHEHGHWTGELEIQRKDGVRITIETSSTILRDRSDKFIGWVELNRDVTERSRIENMRRLQAMVMQQLDESVVVLNLQGEIIECNAKSLDIYGYERDELIGMKAVTMVAGADSDEQEAFRQLAIRGAKDSGSLRFTTTVHRKDGRTIDVEVTYSVLRDDKDEEFARVILSKDVTESKKAKQELENTRKRLEAVIEASGAGIWEQGVVTGHSYMGPVLKDLTGYGDSFGDDISRWRTLIHPDDLPTYDARFKDWDGRKKRVDCEYRLITKTGEIRWVRSRGQIVGNDKQEMVWGVGLGWDITDEKNKDLQQEELEKRLMQSQKMETLGTLAGGIAHDFNNVLTPILGFAHLMKLDSEDEPTLQGYSEQIIGGAERARELIKRILTFSRQIEPTRTATDIYDIATEVSSLITASAPPQVSVSTTRTLDQATLAMADAGQIHQALMNLCTNSLHALDQTRGSIGIHVDAAIISQYARDSMNLQIEPGRYIRLSVEDTGPGIDPEIADRIFDPFFTTKAVDQGTGLGLSVVHGVVEAHGGAIVLDKNIEQGTRFKVYLPACPDDTRAIQPS